MRIILISVLFIVSSCSSVVFYADEKSHVAISAQEFKQDRPTVHSGPLELFLWGTIPSPQSVNLSESILKKDHFQNANVSFEVYRTFGDILKSIFTFGMYSPVHYKISVIGKQYEQDRIY